MMDSEPSSTNESAGNVHSELLQEWMLMPVGDGACAPSFADVFLASVVAMLETNDIKEEDSPFGYELINILKDFCRRHHRTSADSSGILELDSTHIYLPWMFMQLNPKTDSPTYIDAFVASLESFRDTETMGYIANQATTMIIEALGAGSRIQNTVAHSTTNPRQDVPPPNGLEVATTIQEPRPTLNAHLAKENLLTAAASGKPSGRIPRPIPTYPYDQGTYPPDNLQVKTLIQRPRPTLSPQVAADGALARNTHTRSQSAGSAFSLVRSQDGVLSRDKNARARSQSVSSAVSAAKAQGFAEGLPLASLSKVVVTSLDVKLEPQAPSVESKSAVEDQLLGQTRESLISPAKSIGDKHNFLPSHVRIAGLQECYVEYNYTSKLKPVIVDFPDRYTAECGSLEVEEVHNANLTHLNLLSEDVKTDRSDLCLLSVADEEKSTAAMDENNCGEFWEQIEKAGIKRATVEAAAVSLGETAVDLIKTKTKASAMAQGNVGSVWSLIDEECIKIINDDSGSLSPCPPLRKVRMRKSSECRQPEIKASTSADAQKTYEARTSTPIKAKTNTVLQSCDDVTPDEELLTDESPLDDSDNDGSYSIDGESGSDTTSDEEPESKRRTHPSQQKKKASRGIELKRSRRSEHTYDKKFPCLFCPKSVSKFAEHICNKHAREAPVARLLAMTQPRSKERKSQFAVLRKRGMFKHNMNVLAEGEGELIVTRRQGTTSVAPAKRVTDYQPCPKCLGFYLRKGFSRHSSKCCPERTRTEVRAFFQSVLHGVEHEQFGQVLATMKDDEIGTIAKADPLITKYGTQLFERFQCTKAGHVSGKMRELARLLRELKTLQGEQFQLADALRVSMFDVIVKATLSVAKIGAKNSHSIPSLALKIGQSLRKCCFIVRNQALRTDDESMEREADRFLKLYNSEWSNKVSRHATLMLSQGKREPVLPLSEDLKVLLHHVMSSLKDVMATGVQTTSQYRQLVDLLLVRILMFNGKRAGELGKLEMKCLEPKYLSTANLNDLGLSEMELQLCKRLSLIRTIGKGEQIVPILLTPDMKSALDFLVEVRKEHVPDNNIYVFALPGCKSVTHQRGSTAMYNVTTSIQSILKNRQSLTSTKIRKFIATSSQVMDLKANEIEWLANHLGHSKLTHHKFYRLPNDVLQVAKIGKLLLGIEQGIHSLKGRTLDEIELSDLEPDSSSDRSEVDDVTEGEPEFENWPETSSGESQCSDEEEPEVKVAKTPESAAKKPFTKRYWSKEELQIMSEAFPVGCQISIDRCRRVQSRLNGRSINQIRCQAFRLQVEDGRGTVSKPSD